MNKRMICIHRTEKCVRTECVHCVPHEERLGICDRKACGYAFNQKAHCKVLTKTELIIESY
jgi:hypothetical protein